MHSRIIEVLSFILRSQWRLASCPTSVRLRNDVGRRGSESIAVSLRLGVNLSIPHQCPCGLLVDATAFPASWPLVEWHDYILSAAARTKCRWRRRSAAPVIVRVQFQYLSNKLLKYRYFRFYNNAEYRPHLIYFCNKYRMLC